MVTLFNLFTLAVQQTDLHVSEHLRRLFGSSVVLPRQRLQAVSAPEVRNIEPKETHQRDCLRRPAATLDGSVAARTAF